MTAAIPVPTEDALPARPSARRRAVAVIGGFVRAKPLGAAGATVVLLMILTALLANVVAPYDPVETDYGAMFAPPSGGSGAGPLGPTSPGGLAGSAPPR